MPRFALPIFLALAAAFLAGLAIGRHSLRPEGKPTAPFLSEIQTLDSRSSVRLTTGSPGATVSEPGGATPVSIEAILSAIRSAMTRPSDRHGYLEVTRLIDGVAPHDIRPIIDAAPYLSSPFDNPLRDVR